MYLQRSFFLIIFVVLVTDLCQSTEKITFNNYGIGEGLYHTSLSAITQDNNGFVWIGSTEGLQRFDGIHFKHFGTSQNDNSIISNDISCLYATEDNNLLIGYSEGYFTCYDQKTGQFKNYTLNENKPGQLNTVSSIVKYDSVNYLISTNVPAKLYMYNIVEESFLEVKINLDNDDFSNISYLNSIYIDQNQHVWLATERGLFKGNADLSLFEWIRNTDQQCAECNNFISITEIDENRFFILGNSRFYLFSSLSNEFRDITPSEPKVFRSSTMVHSPNNEIWIATYNSGLIRYNIHDNNFRIYQNSPIQENSIPSDYIEALYYSKQEKALWAGTTNGLSLVSLNSNTFNYQTPTRVDGKSIDDNYGILQCRDGSIWIRGQDNLYLKEPGQELYNIILPDDHRFSFLGRCRFFDFMEASDGIVWFGTEKGLVSFDSNTDLVKVYKVQEEVPYASYHNHFTSIIQDSNKLWLSTLAGFCQFDLETKTFTCYPPPDDQNILNALLRTRDITKDKNGNIWIGLNLLGVYRYDFTTNTYTHYVHDTKDDNSISTNTFISFYLDSQDDIWIATYLGGVCRYNSENDSFDNFTRLRGLPSNTVYGILEDSRQNLWMSTNVSVSKFNLNTEEIENFSYDDGVKVSEFNMGSFYKTMDGEMLFGGIGGIVSFYPDNMLRNIHPPQVYITDLHIQNERIDENSEILNNTSILFKESLALPAKKNTVTFDVTLINYFFPSRSKFAWKLEDYDINWNYSRNDQRLISYTNLPQGEYKLLIKSAGNDENWSDEKVILQIDVVPPWWKSFWFRTIIGFIIVVGILGFYSLRIYVLKKQRENLNRAVAEQTEELRSLNENLEEANAEVNAQNDELEKHRNQLEEIVGERTQSLTDALNKAEESDKLKSAILKNMSHEVRTPLNAIIGYANILCNNALSNDEIDEFLKTIQKNGGRLLEMLEDIIHLSKMESEGYKPDYESFNLIQLVDEIILDASANISDKIKLEIIQPFGSQFLIRSDNHKLRSVLWHLIRNAIHFTEKGYINIKIDLIASKELEIAYNRRPAKKYNEFLLFRVEDTGIGILPDELSYIFDVFRKVESRKEKLYGGLGLGLSISKHIVQILDGDIWLESEAGKGSQFYFTLPYIKSEDITSVGKPPKADLSVLEKKTVLIVEDDIDGYKIMNQYLSKYKMKILYAKDGYEAIELYKQHKIDLVILDIILPQMDGFKTMEKLISMGLDPEKVPVIALSGLEYSEIKQSLMDMKLRDYIKKPILYKEFVELLAKSLS